MNVHAVAAVGCGGAHAEQTQQRVYLTREEYITRLEEYLVQLRTEIDLLSRN